jgi:hypothetical protein
MHNDDYDFAVEPIEERSISQSSSDISSPSPTPKVDDNYRSTSSFTKEDTKETPKVYDAYRSTSSFFGEDKKKTSKVYDAYGSTSPLKEDTKELSPVVNNKVKKSGPVEIDTLSELIDFIGVSIGKKASVRAYYNDGKMTVPSNYYEEEAKRFGFSKGYTTLNISYASWSEKDLFAVYHEYVSTHESLKKQGIDVDILPFAYWADNHFKKPTPPANWKEAFKHNWLKMQILYARANLVTLNSEQRKSYEIKIVNGLCYVRNPGKISGPEWILLNYSPKTKLNNRGDALIYVLAEDQKGQKHLLCAVDIPGTFHHSSFNDGSLTVLAAGTMTVKNGVITKITDESGHYRPNGINFDNMIDYLEKQKAISNKTEVSYHTKQPVSSHFSLYLVSKFEPEKCEIKGNAVILDNKNNVYFVKGGILILQSDEKKHEIPQVEKITDRQGIEFSDSKEPEAATSSPEMVKKVIHEAVMKGMHFTVNINSRNLTPEQVNDLRIRVNARKNWELLANSVTSDEKDSKPVTWSQLPPSDSHIKSSLFPISNKFSKQETVKENLASEIGL